MTKIILVLFMVLSLILASCSHESSTNVGNVFVTDSTKGIFVDNSHYEFENTTHGDTVVARFCLQNKTLRTIYVKNVHVSCGCIKAELQDNYIPINGKTWLNLMVDTSNLRGYTRKAVYIISDANEKVLILNVSGVVI